jgi:putative tricarboxylic transport membrane protein
MQQGQEKSVGSVRTWEVLVAACFLVFGSIVVWDSRRLGAQWGDEGPQAGYFPFYIGVFIIVSAVMILYNALKAGSKAKEPFVMWDQLRMILTVLVPSVIYVALMDNPWLSLGMYVPSLVFIAFFMRTLGKYGWLRIAAVSIGTMVAFFLMFEIWFKVPLPKGPLEAALGFG